MITKIQFPTLKGVSKGGYITLEAREYWVIARDIVDMMREIVRSGRELSLDMNYGRLLSALNIGLSFMYAKEIPTEIIFIYPGPSGAFRFLMHNTDYIIFVEEIKDLMKYCIRNKGRREDVKNKL